MTELGTTKFWDQLLNNPAKLAAEICLIDISNLELALQRHPSMRAWVNASHEVAKGREAIAEFDLKKARARALIEASKTNGPGGKPKNADLLKAEAELDPGVQTAMDDYVAACDKRGALRAMSDALEDRLQMLIQISAKLREEGRDYRR